MRTSISEVRKKFLEFFERHGHTIIPSSPLIPEKDVTTLFTSSGMQPLLPYLLGNPHPSGSRLVDSQKCFRAEDIDEVGDNRHTTFFEMLGNWSFGDYFKAEQLRWFFEFLTEEIGLNPERLFITVFAGDENNQIPRDEESVAIWQKLFQEKGIEAKAVELGTVARGGELGLQGGRIFYYDASKNWWSRAGVPEKMPVREPGGPDSEVFYEFEDVLHNPAFGTYCHPNCDCGRFVEIGNSVFMEYVKQEEGRFQPLPQRNVDFGGGLERIAAAKNNDADIFRIDVFRDMRRALEDLGVNIAPGAETRRLGIILDHVRSSVFLVADGVLPSNKEQGYMLRRLIRRAIVHAHLLKLPDPWLRVLSESVIHSYEHQNVYWELREKREIINSVMAEEYQKFNRTLTQGLEEFKKRKTVTGTEAFDLHQTYGFPFALTKELIQERGDAVDEQEFERAFEKHQEISRAGQEKKFGGHGLLLDTGELKASTRAEVEKVTRLHTATHLLQQALRTVLGSEVQQMGSDITVERTRFDFTFGRKLTGEEIKKIEDLVNQKIEEDLPVSFVELPRTEAEKTGALYFFKEKYPDRVKVYFVGSSLEDAFSKEFCGGPHISHTAEVGTFRILKEESIGRGLRRIRGIVKP